MNKLKRILLIVGIMFTLCSFFSCQQNNKNINDNESNSTEISTTIDNTIEDGDISETSIREVKEIVTPMRYVSINPYRDTDKSTFIEIEFSKEIKDNFDATAYIKIEPNVQFTVSKVSKKLILRAAFDAKQTYKITIDKGIKANDGTELAEPITEEIAFEQKKPKLMFSNDGIILPSVNEKKVYVRSLNVKKVKVIVRKVFVNNITQFLQHFNFTGNGKYNGSFVKPSDDQSNNNYDDNYYYDYYWGDESFYNVGDELYNVDFDIENEIDNWVQTAIDLTSVLDTNGIYMVDVRFDEKGTSYKFRVDEDGYLNWEDRQYIKNNGNLQKTLLLTDIGIMAQKNEDGYHVNVLNILNNKPIRGAKVYLMSKNNQIISEESTDTDGVVDFSNQKNSFYIMVDNKVDRSILVLKNALSTNGFAVDGAYVSNGINGYIYTERGVYRPGDPIYLSIIARNNDEPLEDNQPVKITVFDPTGAKMIENDVIKNGKKGFYTYSFKTETSSRTGIWKIEATIGNEVFKKDISVETVVPNKISVSLNIPDVVNYNEDIKDWSISSKYLFGEPAGNLKYGIDFDIREEPINFMKFKDYTFKAPSSYGYTAYKYLNGTLNADGTDAIKPQFDDLDFASLNLLADVSARVTEDGGRNVVSKKYIKLKKFDTYIGIENTNTYRQPNSTLNLKVIAVTDDGETLVPNKKLTYRIYGNDYYWWWDYSDYDNFIRSFKSDKNTKLMKEGSITTKDVPVVLDDTIPDAEYLYVEIEDESTNQIVGVNLQSSEWVDPSVTKKIETLNLISDKKKYVVGDTAQISFKATKQSKAIITIEKSGKILNQYIKDTNDTEIIEQIKITKEMAPNIYVYVTLLQDYNTKENDRPLRLYGVVPINVEDDDTKIDLEITAPEQIRPNEKFTVKIKNKKNLPVDFTIAVVDEGLLDITQFATPSPWDHFFKKLATKLTLFDNYSEIIDRPYGAINQILKVGGDESLLNEMARRRRLKELGLEEADRFTPVSMFKGVLSTDNRGEGTVEFEMPNYMGQVRIMVVAANGKSYGSADKDMLVKAPIIIEPTLPRTMKIGDKMSIPVSVFALEDGIKDCEVYYSFRDKKDSKKVDLNKGDKKIVYFDQEVDNEVTKDKLTVGVKSNLYNYEETVGMAINSNKAPVELSENKELNGKQEASFTQDQTFVKGTVDSMITISNTMLLGLDQRLKYLIRYPYGCVEQTTSSIFPQLFIDKLSTTDGFDKTKIVENINAGIQRLKLFQLSDGSFSYWPGDKDRSVWATNYVGHFLVLAKKNGYYIPESIYNNWLNYTEKTIKGTKMDSKYAVEWKSYALYLLALAGKQNMSEMNYMYENYFNKSLNDSSKMYLAAAYKLSGEERTAFDVSLNINVSSVIKMFDELYARDKYYYSYNYGSKLREIAVYLDCYYTIHGRKDQEAFDELVRALRARDWYSTQTTSYSLIALANVVGDSASNNIKGVIDVDGVKTEYNTNNQYRFHIDETAKNIKVIPDNNGMTYVNYYWEGVPFDTTVEDYSEGFSLQRNYYDDNGKKKDISNVKSGDTFWLEVVVKPTQRNTEQIENIALTQILPTGWEIENLRLTNSKYPTWIEEKAKNTNPSYTDIRDDRIMWFFNHTYNKEYSFFVKINAVTKGEYEFPGTTLEAMYDYNYRAFKKGSKVKVN